MNEFVKLLSQTQASSAPGVSSAVCPLRYVASTDSHRQHPADGRTVSFCRREVIPGAALSARLLRPRRQSNA